MRCSRALLSVTATLMPASSLSSSAVKRAPLENAASQNKTCRPAASRLVIRCGFSVPTIGTFHRSYTCKGAAVEPMLLLRGDDRNAARRRICVK